ncbi:hypothetical protein KIH31_13105 [Paenarthrobacter sp. DKR-5]|uniref:hypothetical protein n=1 Tax=Paenarthrobacter sp. DKR-5 TaxID=2835535 RepID=UPI001BDCBB48|nr:hypothetical protein [Paenarthrobacter sp. DKR-5]MBT1003543.1 hypothetical protein [Paenarthrobacter sp. DKR-5]
MGSAELGDAGGPLLVGSAAALAGTGWGLAALAVLVAVAAGAPRAPGRAKHLLRFTGSGPCPERGRQPPATASLAGAGSG